MSSCLFVNFGRQQAFSLYYFGCGMQQAFYQNPSVHKMLLSLVWWKLGEFTKFSPGFGIHQDFTRFCKFTRFPSGFGNNPVFTKFLEMHQIFTKIWKFTRFSLSFHQVFRFFTKHKRSIRRCQNRIKFSLQWWYICNFETSVFWHHFQEKTARSVSYSLLNTQNASLEWNVGGSLANPP